MCIRDSSKNIGKKLKLRNVGEEDKLVIEDKIYKYNDLLNPTIEEELKEIGITYNLINNN